MKLMQLFKIKIYLCTEIKIKEGECLLTNNLRRNDMITKNKLLLSNLIWKYHYHACFWPGAKSQYGLVGNKHVIFLMLSNVIKFFLQRDLMLSIKSSPTLTLISCMLLYLKNNSEDLCHVFGNYIYCCECRFKIFKLLLLSMVPVRQQIMWK